MYDAQSVLAAEGRGAADSAERHLGISLALTRLEMKASLQNQVFARESFIVLKELDVLR